MPCSGHGTCEMGDVGTFCKCHTGYTGTFCEHSTYKIFTNISSSSINHKPTKSNDSDMMQSGGAVLLFIEQISIVLLSVYINN